MGQSLPTEREVLRAIYESYEASYPGKSPGENDPYLAIDVYAVAERLKCKPHLLFGYLYYFLERKYRFETGPNTYVHLFAIKVGQLRHAVNFPYLAAILAGHDQEHSRQWWSLAIAAVALVLSLAAIIAQVATAST
jgi:hypothetical protein